MKKQYQDGRVIDHVLTADCNSGDVIAKGALVGIAITGGKTGDTIALAIEGVHALPKLQSANIADGNAALIWDVSAKQVIVASAATGDVTGFGVAIGAFNNSTTEMLVKLTPGRGTVTA
jgi:predicted RecA/RadA family phage recombinase